MSDEPLPDWTAALDQWRRGLVDFAQMARAYHEALVAQGFTEAQALALTIAWQTGVQRGTSE